MTMKMMISTMVDKNKFNNNTEINKQYIVVDITAIIMNQNSANQIVMITFGSRYGRQSVTQQFKCLTKKRIPHSDRTLTSVRFLINPSWLSTTPAKKKPSI